MPKVINTPVAPVTKAKATPPVPAKPKQAAPPIDLKAQYTPKQVAEIYGCTRQMVMVYIHRQILNATQIDHQFSPTGKGWVVSGKDLRQFMKDYAPAPELGGAKRGVKKSLPRPITERAKHPLTILQRKLLRAQVAVSGFRDELKEHFPNKEEKCRKEYAAVVQALEQYILATTPTTPHVQVTDTKRA